MNPCRNYVLARQVITNKTASAQSHRPLALQERLQRPTPTTPSAICRFLPVRLQITTATPGGSSIQKRVCTITARGTMIRVSVASSARTQSLLLLVSTFILTYTTTRSRTLIRLACSTTGRYPRSLSLWIHRVTLWTWRKTWNTDISQQTKIILRTMIPTAVVIGTASLRVCSREDGGQSATYLFGPGIRWKKIPTIKIVATIWPQRRRGNVV